jgi:hypothetical protein
MAWGEAHVPEPHKYQQAMLPPPPKRKVLHQEYKLVVGVQALNRHTTEGWRLVHTYEPRNGTQGLPFLIVWVGLRDAE